MKKRYNVVAYQSTRYEMEVEAESATEATAIADRYTPASNAWRHDPGYYGFSVAGAEEIEDE